MEQGLLPPAALWSDARTFDGRPWRGLVDGLIGGIPCQPHSLAGRKGGSNDPRDLWSTARRIIVQSRARLVLIENVSGMLSAGADEIAGAERVWRDLRKLGYAVEGGLFTASEVGASHRRERLFILGVAEWMDDAGSGRRGTGGHDHGGNDRHEPNATGLGALADSCDQGSSCARQHTQQGCAIFKSCNGRRKGHVADRAGGGCRREGDDGQCAAGSNGGCGPVADGDGDGDGLEGIGTDIATPRRKNARRPAGLCDGTAVDHTKNFDRWSELEEERTRSWRAGSSGTVTDVVDADAGSPQEREGNVAIIGRWPEQSAGIEQQAETLAYSRPDLMITTVGETHSRPRRSLNPLFVEWLMGWPPGWTLLAWTDFACSATALCLWKQHMRYALSSLASPQEAPAAQLSLFG